MQKIFRFRTKHILIESDVKKKKIFLIFILNFPFQYCSAEVFNKMILSKLSVQ